MKPKTQISLLALIAVALTSGCPSIHTTQRKIAFDPAEHEPYLEKGGGVIEGQVIGDGNWSTVAGQDVLLVPATNYFREWIDWIKWTTQNNSSGSIIFHLQPDPPDYHLLTRSGELSTDRPIRRTVADREGHFEFVNLPAGSYFICCNLKFSRPGITSSGRCGKKSASDKGWVFARYYKDQRYLTDVVEISDGEIARVMLLSPNNNPSSLPRFLRPSN
jgi:hypothetical protein